MEETPRPRKRSSSDRNTELIRDFLNRERPTRRPRDHLDSFFESAADSLRQMPKLKVAQLKQQIGNIIGQAEIDCALEIDAMITIDPF